MNTCPSNANVYVVWVHHIGAMSIAVAPAFYSAFGRRLAPSNIFPDALPGVAGLVRSLPYVGAFRAGVAEVAPPLHVLGVLLSSYVELLVNAQRRGRVEPLATWAMAAFGAQRIDGAQNTAHSERVDNGGRRLVVGGAITRLPSQRTSGGE